MAEKLSELLNEVKDENTFLLFVEQLLFDKNISENEALTIDGLQGKWANQTIPQFLSAAIAWAEDSEFGLRPGPKPQNTWHKFALFLYAGRGYE